MSNIDKPTKLRFHEEMKTLCKKWNIEHWNFVGHMDGLDHEIVSMFCPDLTKMLYLCMVTNREITAYMYKRTSQIVEKPKED